MPPWRECSCVGWEGPAGVWPPDWMETVPALGHTAGVSLAQDGEDRTSGPNPAPCTALTGDRT